MVRCEARRGAQTLDGRDMCLALFIAAEVDPPLVAWDESAPGFNVVPLAEHEWVVAKHFSKPHIKYLGAHTGCSCGFSYGQVAPTSEEDHQENERGRASVQALRDYLDELLRTTMSLELYVCWEGEWADPQKSCREVTTEFFGGETFDLRERELLVVTSRPSC
jgi:hypothetical protein